MPDLGCMLIVMEQPEMQLNLATRLAVTAMKLVYKR